MTQDVPTLQISATNLQSLISFIYTHERLLQEYGALKIRLNVDCKLALKKRRKIAPLTQNIQQALKLMNDELIYAIQPVDPILKMTQQRPAITDEHSFWSSLCHSNQESRLVNVSILVEKSFFSEKTSTAFFDIHRLPRQSLLKLGGRKLTREFTPCATWAQESGVIFPLKSSRQNLSSIDYQHEGGARHWYIIPARERNDLKKLMKHQNSTMCLDHRKLLIDPSVLDKHRIRYHRVVQYPNEFIVLSAGTLTQGFAEGAGWNESIEFALPSWINEGHATGHDFACQCSVYGVRRMGVIDIKLFRHDLIQKYITTHIKVLNNDQSVALDDSNHGNGPIYT